MVTLENPFLSVTMHSYGILTLDARCAYPLRARSHRTKANAKAKSIERTSKLVKKKLFLKIKNKGLFRSRKSEHKCHFFSLLFFVYALIFSAITLEFTLGVCVSVNIKVKLTLTQRLSSDPFCVCVCVTIDAVLNLTVTVT